jgi:hypothetical protein
MSLKKNNLTDEQLAAAALANANLTPTDAGDEIAGVGLVDLDPPQVTDDEDDGDDEANEEAEESDAEENDTPMPEPAGEDPSEDTEESEAAETHQATGVLQEDDEVSEAGSDVAVRRRSTRIRKKRNGLTIDFNNRAFAHENGVIHINPNVLEQAREDLKILQNKWRM